MDGFMRALVSVWTDSGFAHLSIENVIMIGVGLVLLYLAIAKQYEPLLLLPIAFGDIMANFPNTGFEDEMGVMMAIGFGIKYEIFPPLIFMGVGAMTDFGPLIANPKTMLLGAAAQIGVFVALAGAMVLGFTAPQAAAIGIIGGADGPTAIYLSSKLAPELLGAIAVAAYSYMSLVPLIQPPIMKLCTTKEQRKIRMTTLRPVTHFEKVMFPIVVSIVVSLLLPPVAALMGCLCLGNLFEVSGVTGRLSDTAQNALCNIVTIFLAPKCFHTRAATHQAPHWFFWHLRSKQPGQKATIKIFLSWYCFNGLIISRCSKSIGNFNAEKICLRVDVQNLEKCCTIFEQIIWRLWRRCP